MTLTRMNNIKKVFSLLKLIWKDHIYEFYKKNLGFLCKELQLVLDCIDFAHICPLFISGNGSSIKAHEDI